MFLLQFDFAAHRRGLYSCFRFNSQELSEQNFLQPETSAGFIKKIAQSVFCSALENRKQSRVQIDRHMFIEITRH